MLAKLDCVRVRIRMPLLCLLVLLGCWLASGAALAQAPGAAPIGQEAPKDPVLGGPTAGGPTSPNILIPFVPPKIDSGDTAWMLVATTLVLMMTIPGLALFYGGLVRSKNVLSTLMHSLFCAALVSLLWVGVGYSIAFGPLTSDWCGGAAFIGFAGVIGEGAKPHPLAPTIPHSVFAAYQLTFAIITPALISGAFAERMRFPAFAIFTGLWSLLIYAPLAHWVWGGGWIATRIGALDFAGGTVVHVSSGVSALVCAMFLGKRAGHGVDAMPPHNLPFTVMGAGLLWVGWFGFNAGSALSSGELAGTALVNTNTAAAAAALAWLVMESINSRHATLLGAASGAVAGLVVITPAAGFVSPMAAMAMGGLGGVACYAGVSLKSRLGYDDALDVVGVHFVGGVLGALLTGVFASAAINPGIASLTGGADGKAIFGVLPAGLLSGHPELVFKQAIAVIATIIYCGAGTWILLMAVNLLTPVRADRDEELIGMDLSQHRERAYALGGGEAVSAAAAAVASDPKAAQSPPRATHRFTIALEGLPEAAVVERWRSLCQSRGQVPSASFKSVYASLTTMRDNRFHFRGGDPEQTRAGIEKLFADMAPGVRATIQDHA